jgi:hypothetical protein
MVHIYVNVLHNIMTLTSLLQSPCVKFRKHECFHRTYLRKQFLTLYLFVSDQWFRRKVSLNILFETLYSKLYKI